MSAVDSSVVVAGFASWHALHDAARAELDRRPQGIFHALLESYSVLTRLPAPHRAPPGIVREFLRERFAGQLLTLERRRQRSFLLGLADTGLAGGAVYDALIAATATAAGAELVTCDRRAERTYERFGCQVRLIH